MKLFQDLCRRVRQVQHLIPKYQVLDTYFGAYEDARTAAICLHELGAFDSRTQPEYRTRYRVYLDEGLHHVILAPGAEDTNYALSRLREAGLPFSLWVCQDDGLYVKALEHTP